MASCVIHIDGSWCSPAGKSSKRAIGWGLVAEHNDNTHEAAGAYIALQHQGMNGAHEDIAVLHALQYMRDNGFSPQNTSMYCDDDLFGHAPTYLAKENFAVSKAELLTMRVQRAANFIGHDALVPQILSELARVRMHKVKGHQGNVYQERVNYLAKWEANSILGKEQDKLGFADWLAQGLVIYMAPEESTVTTQCLTDLGLIDEPTKKPVPQPYKPRVRIQYAPFAKTLPSEELPNESMLPSP